VGEDNIKGWRGFGFAELVPLKRYSVAISTSQETHSEKAESRRSGIAIFTTFKWRSPREELQTEKAESR
jgi:hypothetical protein